MGNFKIIVSIYHVSTKADGSLDRICVSVIISGLISFSFNSAWTGKKNQKIYIKLILKYSS
jgi:hypothetical protein